MQGEQRGMRRSLEDRAPGWLVTLGIRSWLLLGVIGVLSLAISLVAFASGLTVPLVIATLLAMLFHPSVDRLERFGVPRMAGTALVVAFLLLVIVATVWVTVSGVITQSPEIVTQVQAGVAELDEWIATTALPENLIQEIERSLNEVGPALFSGAASAVATGLTGGAAFVFGAFIGVFMLITLLSDWKNVSTWIGEHLGLPSELGAGLVEDATSAVRQYFRGLTYSMIVVASLIGLAMWALGVPLAFTIAVVTFLTGYIPFFGAIISGAFAFLVALGSQGVSAAVIVLAVVLVTQNVVQTIVLNRFASEGLKMHPLVTLLATIFGGTAAGLLGATLGAPLAALGIRATARFRAYSARVEAAVEDATP